VNAEPHYDRYKEWSPSIFGVSVPQFLFEAWLCVCPIQTWCPACDNDIFPFHCFHISPISEKVLALLPAFSAQTMCKVGWPSRERNTESLNTRTSSSHDVCFAPESQVSS